MKEHLGRCVKCSSMIAELIASTDWVNTARSWLNSEDASPDYDEDFYRGIRKHVLDHFPARRWSPIPPFLRGDGIQLTLKPIHVLAVSILLLGNLALSVWYIGRMVSPSPMPVTRAPALTTGNAEKVVQTGAPPCPQPVQPNPGIIAVNANIPSKRKVLKPDLRKPMSYVEEPGDNGAVIARPKPISSE